MPCVRSSSAPTSTGSLGAPARQRWPPGLRRPRTPRARAKLKEAWTLYRQERWEELDVLSSELEDTAGLVKMELLEVIFFQAEIALRTDDPDRARRKIEKLDTLMEGVSANHWLRPMLKDLESRITDR